MAIADSVKSSAGGFLRQPDFNAPPVIESRNSLSATPELLKFLYSLAEVAWGAVRKCLAEGKSFIHQSLCQVLFSENTSIACTLFYCPHGLSIFELYVFQKSRAWLFA